MYAFFKAYSRSYLLWYRYRIQLNFQIAWITFCRWFHNVCRCQNWMSFTFHKISLLVHTKVNNNPEIHFTGHVSYETTRIVPKSLSEYSNGKFQSRLFLQNLIQLGTIPDFLVHHSTVLHLWGWATSWNFS